MGSARWNGTRTALHKKPWPDSGFNPRQKVGCRREGKWVSTDQFQLVANGSLELCREDSELYPSRLSKKCCDQLAISATSTEGHSSPPQNLPPLLSPLLSSQHRAGTK